MWLPLFLLSSTWFEPSAQAEWNNKKRTPETERDKELILRSEALALDTKFKDRLDCAAMDEFFSRYFSKLNIHEDCPITISIAAKAHPLESDIREFCWKVRKELEEGERSPNVCNGSPGSQAVDRSLEFFQKNAKKFDSSTQDLRIFELIEQMIEKEKDSCVVSSLPLTYPTKFLLIPAQISGMAHQALHSRC